MKKWLTFMLVAGLATAAQAQNATPDSKAPAAEVLKLKQTSFDFGKIPQGRPVTHNFEVTNTGTEVLRLDNVQASCGCTIPEWSREPIQPGASTTIKVGYNAASEGGFNKTVTIVYNNNQTKTIVISGTVYKAPATSAPANASLSLLKQ
jgi:hypothetical protein